jgi:hypothetical protein
MANKYIDKEYLLEQFKNYDSEVAEHKYSQSSVTVDSALNGTSENPVKNKAIKAALDDKQNKLVAGSNITINNSTNTISATNTNKLDDLIDTNISEPSNGQGLVYNNATGKWENATIQAGSQYTLPTASTEVLGGVKVDGTSITIDNEGVISSSGSSDLFELNDVVITSPSNNDILKYNATTEKWENGEGGDVLGYDETLDVLGLPPNPIYRFRELIPKMTSNATPSGECSAGSINDSFYDAWKAFDDVWSNSNDRWVTAVNVYGSYLQYKFDEAKEVAKIKIQFGDMINSTDVNCGVTIKGSNDGTAFTDLLQFTLHPSDRDKINEYIIANGDLYSYYRIQFDTYNISTSSGKYNGILGVQMYEKYLA